MEYGILNVLWLVGALGFFIFGMKVMSDALQQVAGGKLRNILKVMTTNRYTGVFTGFLISGVLQSSSAATIMTVSFVNAGLITLTESAGVMMGANIGTTITAWIISMAANLNISVIALPTIALAFPMMFSQRENVRKWSEVLIGFAILFLGLAELKDAVPNLHENEELMAFLKGFSDPNIFNSILFVVIGTLLTIIMQSSSAAMALTIMLAIQGLPLGIAAAMVLGENIGTTITAELASAVANVHAKRSARIHSLFNIFGVIWMILLLPFVLNLINMVFVPVPGSDSNIYSIAAFHTVFNVLNVLILIGFVPFLVRVVTQTVKSKGDDDEIFRLQYINQGMFGSAEISLEEAKKEVLQFYSVIEKMHKHAKELLTADKDKRIRKLAKKMEKLERFTDELEEEIARFLIRLAVEPLKTENSLEIKSVFSNISDMERIADVYIRMANDIIRKNNQKCKFNKGQINNLNKIAGLVDTAIEATKEYLENEKSRSTPHAKSYKYGLAETIKELRNGQLLRIEKEADYDVKAGIVYRDIYNSFDQIGELLFSISKSYGTEIGEVEAELIK